MSDHAPDHAFDHGAHCLEDAVCLPRVVPKPYALGPERPLPSAADRDADHQIQRFLASLLLDSHHRCLGNFPLCSHLSCRGQKMEVVESTALVADRVGTAIDHHKLVEVVHMMAVMALDLDRSLVHTAFEEAEDIRRRIVGRMRYESVEVVFAEGEGDNPHTVAAEVADHRIVEDIIVEEADTAHDLGLVRNFAALASSKIRAGSRMAGMADWMAEGEMVSVVDLHLQRSASK